jgi:hypothetical protein
VRGQRKVVFCGDRKADTVATYMAHEPFGVGEEIELHCEYLGYKKWRVVARIADEWWLHPAKAGG